MFNSILSPHIFVIPLIHYILKHMDVHTYNWRFSFCHRVFSFKHLLPLILVIYPVEVICPFGSSFDRHVFSANLFLVNLGLIELLLKLRLLPRAKLVRVFKIWSHVNKVLLVLLSYLIFTPVVHNSIVYPVHLLVLITPFIFRHFFFFFDPSLPELVDLLPLF